MAIDVNISTEFINDTDTPASYVGQATKKLVVKADETGIEFIEDSSGGGTNIMNANLTADADRTQDLNSHSMYFNNGKQFKWLNNVAPTIGEGSFDYQGFGTTESSIVSRMKNGSGYVISEQYGTGSFKNFSTTAGYKFGYYDSGFSHPTLNLDSPAASASYIRWYRAGSEVARLGNYQLELWLSSNQFQMRDLSNNNIHIVKNTSGEWVFDNDATGATTPETNVRAKFIASSGQTALKTVGKVNFNTLPTSSVGLSSGDLWNDSGTIKIV